MEKMVSSLQDYRERAGYTQSDVAKELRVSRPTYSAWEKNPSSIRVERARQIAELFNISLKDIFDLCRTPEEENLNGLKERLVSVFEEFGFSQDECMQLSDQAYFSALRLVSELRRDGVGRGYLWL